MLLKQINYLFSNASVFNLQFRNIKLYSYDMDKVCGINKIDLQDGQM
jgi:hypothetical protein